MCLPNGGKLWRQSGGGRSLLTLLMEVVELLVERLNRRGLHHVQQGPDNIFRHFVDMFEANDTEDVFSFNSLDIELLNAVVEGNGGFFGIAEKVVHHEDEEERSSLFANSEGLIGLRDLHTEVVGDVVLEEVVGEFEVLLEIYVGHPFAVPEVRSGYLFNGDVGIVGIEVLDFFDSFVVVRNDDREDIIHIVLKVCAFGLSDQDFEVVGVVELIFVIER
jgi:hypothetical protein